MGFSEQLYCGYRDAVLIADSAARPVVGHREGFGQCNRLVASPPQVEPRPCRLAAPRYNSDGQSDRQTHCGARISPGDPAGQTRSEDTDDDRQLHRGGHRSRPARRINAVNAMAPATTAAKTSATVRARWSGAGAGAGGVITRLCAAGGSRSPAGTSKVRAATGSIPP